MKKIAILAIVVLMAMTITSAVYSQCSIGELSEAGDAIEGEGGVVNDICPVMGGAVSKDTPYKTIYKGKTIGFCCAGCVGAFGKDPEAYVKKIDALQDKDINERR